MPRYPILDYLPTLPPERMARAPEVEFSAFSPTTPYDQHWDNYVFYDTYKMGANGLVQWTGTAGATYKFQSASYYDPYLIQVYDTFGNVVATAGASFSTPYGVDTLNGFVAPYSGEYYVDGGWNRGSYYKYATLKIWEDTDTAPVYPDPYSGKTVHGFNKVFYLGLNRDVAATEIDPVAHYNEWGWREGRDPNALFDTDWYLATYEDVRGAEINPLEHYMLFGWQEGRDPSANFDTSHYLETHVDVALAGVNPLEHYLNWGIMEGREIAVVA